MNILDFLYEKDFKKITFWDRKVSVSAKKSFIKGVPKSGKSYLIYDYLSRFPKDRTLYIDLKDERVEKSEIVSRLEAFIENRKIQVLALDNFDFSFSVPECEEVVISSVEGEAPEGFEEIELYPLDFEEFLSFYKKYSNLETAFNLYAKIGTYPQIVLNPKEEVVKSLQEIVKLSLDDGLKYKVFKEFALSQGNKRSLFQIFNKIKERERISKDRFYEICEELIREKFIFLLEKYGQKRAAKRVFLIDFVLKNAFTFQKDFIKLFENMIFLELLKRKKEIFYLEGSDFYIPKEKRVVLPMPFLPLEMIRLKVKLFLEKVDDVDISLVEIITLGDENIFSEKKRVCEVLSFWDWALRM